MADSKGRMDWSDLWAVRKKSSPEWQTAIDTVLGYKIDPGTQKITITPKFHHETINSSITELTAFLSGAPIPVLKLYLHMLPLKYVKKVALCYPKSDLAAIEEAYFHPMLADDKKHLLGAPKTDEPARSEKS